MNRISLEHRGMARWFDFSGSNVSRAHETSPTSVLEAVRFVMEQLPPDIRGSAWVETDTGSIGIGDIQALYPTIRSCPRSKAVAERRALEPDAGGDTSTWDAEGGAQVSER
jgi:hypothetical protein